MVSQLSIKSLRIKNTVWIVAMAFLPVLIYWALKELIFPRPSWAMFDHWEAMYYYTSMDLLEGLPIHNADNPGTPLQFAGFFILKFIGLNPQDYPKFLFAAHVLILFMSFIAAFMYVHIVLAGAPNLLQSQVFGTTSHSGLH